jgi:RNA polymerase sigma factor (sigma-70 family)
MPSAASRLMPTLRRVVLAGAGADRTDGQLLGSFVTNRDADAFAGLVRRHGPMVLGVCRRVVGDQAVADDAFQAVFIVLARRAGAVKPREQVGNWLYGVAYRTALKARAVLARRRSREKQVDVMPEPPVSHRTTADWADLQPVIDEELARLPDKLRVPVVLCDLEGRAQRDVARHLGIPPATLATRIATARRTLAARLTKRGVTLSGGALAGMLSANGAASAVPIALSQGVVRAAEAVLGGGVPLVSAHAVQLSEGVMRMMLITKLKAVAVTAVTVLALSGGLGLGLVPAFALTAGQESAPGEKSAKKATEPPALSMDEFIEAKLKDVSIDLTADVDDATFLRRLSLDLRGTMPTVVETYLFIADPDENKRGKVVVWMSDDGEVKAHAAKKLGVNAQRIRQTRLVDTGDGQPYRLVVVLDTDENEAPRARAVTPDGKRVAIELVADADDHTVRVAPLVLDLDARVDLNAVRDSQTLNVIVDKEAQWTDVQGAIAPVKNGEVLWARIGDDRKVITGKALTKSGSGGGVHGLTFTTGDDDGKSGDAYWVETQTLDIQLESDVDFLRRVIKDVRGGTPTALEAKYFAEDKDPKKREKLLDQLLKDPAVAKKVGDDWKKRMLATNLSKEGTYHYRVVPKTAEFKPEVRRWILPGNDPKQPGGSYLFQVVPAVDPKSGKWHVDPKLIPMSREGVFEWRVDPSPKKEGVFEWKFEPPAKPRTPNAPSPAAPVDPPKTRTVKVVPAAPTTPVTPRTSQTKVVPATVAKPAAPAKTSSGKTDRLVDLLIAAKKSDADILDFITIDILGRLPTDAEKRLTLGLVGKAADKRAAWMEVARALAATSAGRERSSAKGPDNVIELEGVVDFDVGPEIIKLTGTVEGVRDIVRLRVDPEVRTAPEIKPRAHPADKSLPPAKK